MTAAVFSQHLSGIKDQMRLLAQVIDMTEQRELANLRRQMVNVENDDQIQQAAIDGSDNDSSLSLKSIPETVHLKLWRSELAELQALYDEYQTEFGESAGRELGTVHCHPPISMNSEAYCIDWALIRLNNCQVPESGAVNGIQLGHMDDLGLLNKAGFSVSLSLDLLYIIGVLPRVDAEHGSHKVLKRGARTGLTVGRTGPVSSFVRFKQDVDGSQVKVFSKERPIFGIPNTTPFSAEGDSGSTVVNERGQVFGIITGGSGPSPFDQSLDITYATPMWVLMDSMRTLGLDPHLV